jgi:hypothetical protein
MSTLVQRVEMGTLGIEIGHRFTLATALTADLLRPQLAEAGPF